MLRRYFTNPLRLAWALASPFAGEEGDQNAEVSSNA